MDTTTPDKTDQLLEETSRTFALCIPLLPEPARQEVSIAYLLFRIADTFEDSAIWSPERRIEALEAFEELMDAPTPAHAEQRARAWTDGSPTDHDGYQNLLKETPAVVREFGALDDDAQHIIRKHVKRTAQRMASYVRRTDTNGTLRLRTMEELRVYCYAVAGIVGEMLTELFVRNWPLLREVETYLEQRAPSFGEGLQLTNILKDTVVDVEEGRSYLAGQLERDDVFERAHADLDAAAEYTLALQKAGAPRGAVAFNALPLRLAWGTLDRVEEEGPGAKLTRPEVFDIVDQLHTALGRNDPAVDYPAADQPLEAFKEESTASVNDAPAGPEFIVNPDEMNVAQADSSH